jgi:hypothetical protein
MYEATYEWQLLVDRDGKPAWWRCRRLHSDADWHVIFLDRFAVVRRPGDVVRYYPA